MYAASAGLDYHTWWHVVVGWRHWRRLHAYIVLYIHSTYVLMNRDVDVDLLINHAVIVII